MVRAWLRLPVACGSFVLAFASPVRSQCLTWSEFGEPSSTVYSSLVFDDGSGPALYVGGDFLGIGGIQANHIARWNGQSWSTLGAGVNARVLALAAFDDGSGPALYAGGIFNLAGGAPASHIARWNGSSWSPLGTGMDDRVKTLAVFDDGTGTALYAGGDFAHAGGTPAFGIARWNGSAWAPVGNQYLPTNALAVFQSGGQRALYAGGFVFPGPSGGGVNKWDGTSWQPVGGGVGAPNIGNFVGALTTFDDGTGPALYAGGTFATAGGVAANGIARWDGTAWSPLGLGIRGARGKAVLALQTFDDGSGPALYAGGNFERAGNTVAGSVASWNGHAWSPLHDGLVGEVYAFTVFDSGAQGVPDLVVGGGFSVKDEEYENRLAVWHGCKGPGTLLCFGDGSATACPCANSGEPRHGCANSSVAEGALLSSSGSTNPDSVVLHASGEPRTAFTIFLQGDAALATAHAFGDGLLCAGGNVLRLYARHATNGLIDVPGAGDASISARSAALGDPLGSGSVRYYQGYYRDPSASFCPPPNGGGFNASNAVRVVW